MASKRRRKKRRSSATYKANHPISSLYLIPVYFIIAIVPLIVFGKVIELTELEALNWIGGSIHIDFFNYYKAIWFMVGVYTSGLLLLILYWMDKLDLVRTKYYIPLAVYIVFTILSAIFAEDSTVAIRGYISMFQGLFVLIGYALFVITIFNLVKAKNHVKWFIYSLVFLGSIIGFIGITQYFGHDIFETSFGRRLILPSAYDDQADLLGFKADTFGIYATLYNPNYVGSFAALMIPLSFALYFYQKKPIYIALALGFVGLMVFVGFGSNSRAGYLGVLAAIFFMAILFRKEAKKKPLFVIVPLVSLIILGFVLNVITDGNIVDEFSSMSLSKAIQNIKDENEDKLYFESITFDDYTGIISTSESSIKFVFVGSGMEFYTLDDEPLETSLFGSRIDFVDEEYSDFMFRRNTENPSYTVNIYNEWFEIFLTIDGFALKDVNGEYFTPTDPGKVEFLEPYGRLFSSRVYIWSRSIPLLKNNIFIGAGPDHYSFEFPQEDYTGKINYMSKNVFVSKPHNMYLDIAINTGLVSLIALLTVFGMYIVDSFKLYFYRSFETFEDYIGAGIFVSILAYLVAGVFNDQVISVAPIFYGLLGLGIAINLMIKKAELIH